MKMTEKLRPEDGLSGSGAGMTDQPMPTPVEVMGWLNHAAGELDALGKRLEAAHIALGDTETRWIDAKDVILLDILETYEKRGERPPAEDMRMAMVRGRIDDSIYVEYIKAEHLVKGIEKRCRKLETAVSARQSTLRGMRDESQLHQAGFTGRAAA